MVEEQQQPENGEQPEVEEAAADESAVGSPQSAEERAAAEEPAAEEPAAEEPAAEEQAAEEPAAEEQAAEEPAAEEAPAEEPAPAPAAEPEERLTPKERRKRERSLHTGEARPQRSPEERNRDRLERRAAKATARRRARSRAHERRGEPGTGTTPRERAPGSRKVRQGVVVSAKPEKTITVRIEIARRHPVYEKVVRRTNTVHAHDERNEAQEGDVVRVVESRPLSRTKRWRLVEILERAR
jgi:small subunit ribosomal protein S17